MTVSHVKERFQDLSSRMNASESIFLAAGIIAVVVGVLIDVFVLRIICLVVVLGSAALAYASYRAKHLRIHAGAHGSASSSRSQSESDVMKKLIFDDFQNHADREERIEEAEGIPDREEEAHGAQPADAPARTPSFPTMKMPEHAPSFEFRLSDFFDVDSAIYKGEAEPRTEFDFLLMKLLTAVKEVLFAHTVAFFWANREKGQMVLEARVTDSAHFSASRRFPIGHDLVSNVAQSGKPEFISEVNPDSEAELLRYYDTPCAVKSFLGVPVYFAKGSDDRMLERPVGVIAVDSLTSDEFGPETLTLLGHFTKLVSALIKSYNDKYDLLIESELLSSIRRLQERIRSNFSLPTIVQALAEETSKLINWDFLAVVLFDESAHAWCAKKVTNRAHDGYITLNRAIDFPESIVGQTIRRNAYTLIDDIETASCPRYFGGEELAAKGSFLAVPLSSLNKCYGAICLESREKYNFSRRDVDHLYRLADHAASALEIFYLQDVINEYVIIDDLTGVYSKKFFTQRVEDELQRADDGGSELSLLFITVDKSGEIQERYGNEGFERVMVTVARAIRASVRSYDIVGRYDRNQFGALLVNTAANEAYLWAEKIRKTIAGLAIGVDGRSISITISIGVCGALEGMKKEELLGNTVTVLNRAADAGGNVVRVF